MLIYLALIETDSDKEKFETIYTEYRGLMFYVANKILGDTRDSEDIVHDAFVKIAEIIEKIDTAKSPKTPPSFVTVSRTDEGGGFQWDEIFKRRNLRRLFFFDGSVCRQ